jgi:membrane-associated phospholipid phosphatase
MLEFNTQLFVFLSQYSQLPFIWICADLPIFFLPIFLFWMWLYYSFYWKSLENKINLLHIFYACITWIILSYVIKTFVDIDRPETYLENSKNLIMNNIPSKSFPSDHATISIAFVTGLFYTWYKSLSYIILPIIALMNLSRIIVGVHWPLDILAWTLVWIFSAFIFFTYFSKLKFVKFIDLFIIKTLSYIKI